MGTSWTLADDWCARISVSLAHTNWLALAPSISHSLTSSISYNNNNYYYYYYYHIIMIRCTHRVCTSVYDDHGGTAHAVNQNTMLPPPQSAQPPVYINAHDPDGFGDVKRAKSPPPPARHEPDTIVYTWGGHVPLPPHRNSSIRNVHIIRYLPSYPYITLWTRAQMIRNIIFIRYLCGVCVKSKKKKSLITVKPPKPYTCLWQWRRPGMAKYSHAYFPQLTIFGFVDIYFNFLIYSWSLDRIVAHGEIRFENQKKSN